MGPIGELEPATVIRDEANGVVTEALSLKVNPRPLLDLVLVTMRLLVNQRAINTA